MLLSYVPDKFYLAFRDNVKPQLPTLPSQLFTPSPAELGFALNNQLTAEVRRLDVILKITVLNAKDYTFRL